MNRTDGEPETETDVMATAFSTMRKYGSNIINVTLLKNIGEAGKH